MAFNFNWSPLTADADFYKRAQEMLTTALNKSPKPPIIVDDILVNELNLAEDRFRGIFKMCYSGDAFLTLKTRVQVCPTAFAHITFPSSEFSIPDGMRWKLQIASRKDTRAGLLHSL
jgi:hypothetical protein